MIQLQGNELHISMEYDAPVSFIWEMITDTDQWPKWGPSLARVESSDRFIKAGSNGRVQTVLGFWLPFTIHEFEEYEYWGWRIGKYNASGHRLAPLKPTGCELTFTMPWWAAPYLLICYIALRRIKNIPYRQEQPKDI